MIMQIGAEECRIDRQGNVNLDFRTLGEGILKISSWENGLNMYCWDERDACWRPRHDSVSLLYLGGHLSAQAHTPELKKVYRLAKKFRHQYLKALQIFRHAPSSIDLAKSNPALMVLILKKYESAPIDETIQTLFTLKRREMLHVTGLPASERVVRFFPNLIVNHFPLQILIFCIRQFGTKRRSICFAIFRL